MNDAVSTQAGSLPAVVIVREDDDLHGRYVAQSDTTELGALTYAKPAPGRLVAMHTVVAPAGRGKGIGQALVARLIEDAVDEGFMIVPRCPFVAEVLARSPDRAKLLAKP